MWWYLPVGKEVEVDSVHGEGVVVIVLQTRQKTPDRERARVRKKGRKGRQRGVRDGFVIKLIDWLVD